MIRHIGHLALYTGNMEASLHFYVHILGFEKAFALPDAKGNIRIEGLKICERQFIELFYGGANKHEPVAKPIGFNHLCFEVDSIEQIAERLRANDWPIDIGPKQALDTNYVCWTKDPDGNRIEFVQMTPGSPQMLACRQSLPKN
jgi:catechol 2,3-dioxygenase-like lactoylglutathione lyase family enzyme